ncbi:MAG: hypothetical protein HQ557_07905 [Bacteroidetes bacterium]|nr:hypothetical protein [Bacteroidota bacterium]
MERGVYMKVSGASVGNGSIAILIHDDSNTALLTLEQAVLSALQHFGIPFTMKLVDAEWTGSSAAKEVLSHAAVMLPQSGTFSRFSKAYSEQLKQAVDGGLGLVCYEPQVELLPGWVQQVCKIDPASIRHDTFSELITRNTEHFITWTRPLNECVWSDQKLDYSVCTADGGVPGGGTSLLESEAGDSLVLLGDGGTGRIVLFPFSVKFFTMEYLGHACGADDIFTRSLIWAARKPFLTWSMPPKAGLVIDDCSGSYDHFGYLDVMNKHDWVPYLGLFTETIDEVAHEDIHMQAKKLHVGWVDGSIDIGFHALRYNDSFCFNHLDQCPRTISELQIRFASWDRYEKQWGIQHSPWAHPHFGEVGSNAIPFYLERGIEFLTYILPLDAAWFEVPSVKEPLSMQPPFGHAGYYISELPNYPEMMVFNCVLDHKNRTSADYVVRTDYLWDHTTFWNEAEKPMIQESAQTLADQIRRGIDSGFYGEGATHEQRVACLRKGELEEVFQETDRLLSRYPMERCKLSSVMAYVKQRRKSQLESVRYDSSGRSLQYAFSNDHAIGTEVQVYFSTENGEAVPVLQVLESQEGSIGDR